MPYRPIIGTLAYVWDRAADTVLLVHRNARADDEHLGKYNGLGGKLEPDEDVVSGVRRELLEEAALHLDELALRGTISWPGFGANGEDWLGFVFVVTAWHGTVPASNPEGTLSWVPRRRLLDACSDDEAVRAAAALPMWEGDKHFLPLVFDDDPRPFWAVMPWADGRPVDWRYNRL
ncbi:MAG: NUDIX domain-containing protein [Acidimicrobiia bacterium]